MTDVSPISSANPARADAQMQAFLAAQEADAVPELPVIPLPPEGVFRLPGGYVPGLELDEVVYEAEVRELTGRDEERIEKARRSNRADRFINAIIVSGTERIGDIPASEEVLDGLLVGDREMLLLEIRRATYGEEIAYEDIQCPSCLENFDLSVSLDDIPIEALRSPSARFFEVPLKRGGHLDVRLPTGADQAFIFGQDADTTAEINTLLLSRCILAITRRDGTSEAVVGSVQLVQNLTLVDRKKVLEEISKRQPGPRYAGVIVSHPGCEKGGTEVPFAISVGDMFPDL